MRCGRTIYYKLLLLYDYLKQRVDMLKTEILFKILAYHDQHECEVPTLMTAIGAVCDMLMIYGLDLIAQPEENELSDSVSEVHRTIFAGGTSLTNVIQGLVDLMDDEVSALICY